MKRRTLTAALLGLPAATFASGDASWLDPIWGIPSLFWQLFNFSLVVILFYFLLRKAAPSFFRSRAEEIKDALNKAVREKEEAMARLQEVEGKMAKLDDELAAIEAEAKETAEIEKKRLTEEAEAERERLHRDSKDELERRVQEVRRELREYAAELVENAAREILEKEIGAKDEARLMAAFLDHLEEDVRERNG